MRRDLIEKLGPELRSVGLAMVGSHEAKLRTCDAVHSLAAAATKTADAWEALAERAETQGEPELAENARKAGNTWRRVAAAAVDTEETWAVIDELTGATGKMGRSLVQATEYLNGVRPGREKKTGDAAGGGNAEKAERPKGREKTSGGMAWDHEKAEAGEPEEAGSGEARPGQESEAEGETREGAEAVKPEGENHPGAGEDSG